MVICPYIMTIWLTHRLLQAFAAVITSGGVSRAAYQLHISQPAVSRLIKDLEANVGFPLFDRIQGRLVPTEEALSFYAEVERSFTGLEEISRAAQQIAAGRRQDTLSIAAIPSVGQVIVPGALAGTINGDRHPTISVVTGTSSSVLQMVSSRQADIGIIASFSLPAGIRIIEVVSTPFYVILPTHYALADKMNSPSLKILQNETLIEFATHTHTRILVEEILRKEDANFKKRIATDLAAMVSTLVLENLGIAVVDAFTARLHVKLGGHALPLLPRHTFEVQIIGLENREQSTLSRNFVDNLISQIRIEP